MMLPLMVMNSHLVYKRTCSIIHSGLHCSIAVDLAYYCYHVLAFIVSNNLMTCYIEIKSMIVYNCIAMFNVKRVNDKAASIPYHWLPIEMQTVLNVCIFMSSNQSYSFVSNCRNN